MVSEMDPGSATTQSRTREVGPTSQVPSKGISELVGFVLVVQADGNEHFGHSSRRAKLLLGPARAQFSGRFHRRVSTKKNSHSNLLPLCSSLALAVLSRAIRLHPDPHASWRSLIRTSEPILPRQDILSDAVELHLARAFGCQQLLLVGQVALHPALDPLLIGRFDGRELDAGLHWSDASEERVDGYGEGRTTIGRCRERNGTRGLTRRLLLAKEESLLLGGSGIVRRLGNCSIRPLRRHGSTVGRGRGLRARRRLGEMREVRSALCLRCLANEGCLLLIQ
jgi:hypothetical protein